MSCCFQTSLRVFASLTVLAILLVVVQSGSFNLFSRAKAQQQQRTVTVDVDLPSTSTGSATGTLAVRVFAPSSAALARYSEGAPVMVFATGGDDVGTLANQIGRAEDVIRIVFVYPGGRDLASGRASAGTYDFRGENSIAAMRDVIFYAAGQLRDSQGRRINDVVPVSVINNNIGLFGSSNGGNMVVAVLAQHGAQLAPYIKYFIQWESPVCSQVATSDAGATQLDCAGNQRQSLASGNPWYAPSGNTTTSLNIDYSRARYNASNTARPVFFDGNGDGRYTTVADPTRPGCQTPDLNGDGRISTDEDRPLGAYRMTGNKQVYSRQATQGLAATGTVTSWPLNIATVAEANAFWDIREAVLLYQTAIDNVPGLESMVLTSFTDHVQTQMPENAHVKMAFDGMNSRGRWVKINPTRSYYTAIDPTLANRTDIPNNAANTAPTNWSDRRSYTYPDDLDQVAWAAAVQEMADRARARNSQPTPTPTPANVTIVNAANYNPGPVATESIVALFGTNLAIATQVGSIVPLPTSLAGTTVTVRDSLGTSRMAPLFFVSPNQINCVIPAGTAIGAATLTVTSGDGKLSAATIQISRVAPGLFTADGSGNGFVAGYVLRVKANGAQVVEQIARWDSALGKMVGVPIDLSVTTDQVYFVAFGTGFRWRSSLAAVGATIGGIATQVLFAGEQGGFVGVDQINLLLPNSLVGRGEVNLMLTVDGQTANPVKLQFH